MTITKKSITEKVTTFSPSELEMSLIKVREYIDILIDVHGPDAQLNYDKWHRYDYSNEYSPIYTLEVSREETDAELADRLQKEKEQKIARKAAAFSEIERLRKEFGDPSENK